MIAVGVTSKGLPLNIDIRGGVLIGGGSNGDGRELAHMLTRNLMNDGITIVNGLGYSDPSRALRAVCEWVDRAEDGIREVLVINETWWMFDHQSCVSEKRAAASVELINLLTSILKRKLAPVILCTEHVCRTSIPENIREQVSTRVCLRTTLPPEHTLGGAYTIDFHTKVSQLGRGEVVVKKVGSKAFFGTVDLPEKPFGQQRREADQQAKAERKAARDAKKAARDAAWEKSLRENTDKGEGDTPK